MSSAQTLNGNEFGDLLGDVRHGVLIRAQAIAGAQERADGTNLVVGHPVRRGSPAGISGTR